MSVDPRFELGAELGRGGMGIVYRARDRERGGEVALKALKEIRQRRCYGSSASFA